MANIKNVKTSIEKGVREIIDVSFAIERSSSSIKSSDTLSTFSEFPIDETDLNDIKLNLKIKEDISAKFPNGKKDGQSLIISLLSMYNQNSNKRNHIISLEIEDNEIIGYFVNTIYLEEDLNISKLFTDKLKRSGDLRKILNDLIIVFLSKAQNAHRNKYGSENFENYSVRKKIDMCRDLLNSIYGTHNKIDEMYYLFFVDDINIKSSLFNYYNNKKNSNYINTLTYRIYNSNLNDNKDDKKFKLANAFINFKNEKLKSDSQKIALADIDKQITLIIGQGGSGKTFLASYIMKKFLELNALGFVNGHNINGLYTTYSKYSLSQFELYSNNVKELIFTKNKENIQQKIESFNHNIDSNIMESVKGKLKSISKYKKLFENYTSKRNLVNRFQSIYANSYDFINYNKLIQYLRYLKDNKVEPSLIDSILMSIGVKKESFLYIPSQLVRPLNLYGVNVPEQISNGKIDEIINQINSTEISRQKKTETDFERLKEELLKPFDGETMSFDSLDIDFDNLTYYLKYKAIYENPDLKGKYIKELQNVLNNKEVDYNLIADLYPIFAGLTTDIADLNIQFGQIIVDESVLVPGYFLPLITNKGDNIIAMGDINQLSLNQSFYPNVNSIVDKIYSDSKGLKLSIDNSYNQKSFFDHMVDLMEDRRNMLLLTDNFRSNKDIFLLSKEITKGIDSYEYFLGKYVEKNNLKEGTENLTKHYGNETPNYIYGGSNFSTPFLFADSNDSRRYDNIFTFLNQNKINKSDIMIITPFKDSIKNIRTLVGDSILIDIIENVQGVEKKVIIFDWGVSSVDDEAFKYIDIKKFNLILLRAKDIFITIGDNAFLFENQIANIEGNGYTIINKFTRNKNIDIFKLT